MNAEVIGEKIKNLREKNNISRENFANAVEISQSALCIIQVFRLACTAFSEYKSKQI